MENDILIKTLLNMVRNNPNDADLGKKVRSLLLQLLPEHGNNISKKQILKD